MDFILSIGKGVVINIINRDINLSTNVHDYVYNLC